MGRTKLFSYLAKFLDTSTVKPFFEALMWNSNDRFENRVLHFDCKL